MGIGGRRKTFFHGKKPKRRLRYIFVSSLSTVALCEGGSKKAGYFEKGEISTYGGLSIQGIETTEKESWKNGKSAI